MLRWERVEQLAERAPSVADLHFHRLELVAARGLRNRGRPVGPQLVDAERYATVVALAAPVVLRRARAAYGGRMVLMKGPELAARYPDPALRPYRDLDLLVDDAAAAHHALLHAGFALAGLWADHLDLHHLRPLCWPGLPIGVELHSRAHFPDGLPGPSAAELIAGAVPSRFAAGVVDALDPASHTLVVAAHAWAEAPLASLGQLVDCALLAQEAGASNVEALAKRWNCHRLWHVTRAAIEALDDGRRARPAAMRICGPHLRAARERTLLERHVEELASPLFGLPPCRGAAASARVLARRVLPADEETWSRKLRRALRALRNRRVRHSQHDARLPPEDRYIGGVQGLEEAPIPERRPAQ